jgi:hypothetical protein
MISRKRVDSERSPGTKLQPVELLEVEVNSRTLRKRDWLLGLRASSGENLNSNEACSDGEDPQVLLSS